VRGQSRLAPAYPGTTVSRRGLTRRAFGALSAAAALAPARALADLAQALIIAEGGSAERPQDTRSAYDLAINAGCDFIQASLALSQEGALIVSRDNELSATTDVAARSDFAARKTAKTIDGAQVTGWFAEDFTLAELKTLTRHERWPALRPASAKFNGQEPVLTLQETLAIARAGCVRTARTIGVMPRLLHASYYANLGLPIEERLAGELRTAGYDAAAAAVWVQAPEPSALQALSRFSQVRRMQIIEAAGAPDDDPSTPFSAMSTSAGLGQVRGYAAAICADQNLVFAPDAALFPAPTTLALDAHTAGLPIFSFAARAENAFLPKLLQKGDRKSSDFAAGRGDIQRLLVALFANGLDGVATDQPALAAKARAQAADIAERSRPRR
jgi:glycerophosphoryl diester phosphodiesterase